MLNPAPRSVTVSRAASHRLAASKGPTLRRLLPGAVLGALLCLGTGSAWAESLISGITPSLDQHGTAFIIHSDSRPAYNVNILNGGYRVQIDFANAHFLHSVGNVSRSGAVQNVLTKNLGHNARLDLLLKSPRAVMVEPTVGGYRLAFTRTATISAHKQRTAPAKTTKIAHPVITANPIATSSTSVRNSETAVNGLNFKRGKLGGGILDLSITGPQPEMNLTREAGNRLVVELKNTTLPASYTHRFGVTQFGTPVQYVDSYPINRNARLVFAVHGPYTYSAYQLGHQTRIVVHHKTARSTLDPENSARLSMTFQDISVRDALQVIADFTHQNIVVSNTVKGSLSIRLKNEPWKQAFKVILESQGLAVKHIGNILWVAPASQITSQEEAELKADASKRKLEPLETQLIQIKYAKASSIAALLRGFDQNKQPGAPDNQMSRYQQQSLANALGLPKSSIIGNSLLGPRGSVAVVTRTNSLLVRDTPRDIENIKKLIAKIDKPVPQVLIEARIVQITTSAAHSLGVNWGGTYTSHGAGGIVNLSGTGATGTTETQGGAYPIQGSGSSGSTTGTGFTVPALANLAASSAGTALANASPASLGFALGTTAGNRILDLQLQALQVNNEAKIISSPKVLTEDNEKALISQGQEIPYRQSTSSGATSVSFKKAELRLNVTPHISPHGKIALNVVAQNNQPDYADALPSGIPINSQEVKTKLLVNNGQTIVIGGIYTDATTHNQTGVPVLQDIPLLGWLFKGELHSVAKTELLVFITPKIIGGDDILGG